MKPKFTSSESHTPDQLHAGDYPIRTAAAVLLAGQVLARGAVLGKITASDKYTLSASAAGDGSEVPDVILAEDADSTGGDVNVTVYIAGDFNSNHMSFGVGHDANSVRSPLRDKNLYVVAAISA